MGFDDPLILTILALAMPVLALNVVNRWAVRNRWDTRLGLRFLAQGDGLVVNPAADPDRGATPGRSLSETRLRAPAGMRAALVVATGGLAVLLLRLHDADMLRLAQGAVPWPELLLLAGMAWHTLAMWTWELRFDAVGLSAPVLILGRRARLWRTLVAVTDDSPFAISLRFADGAVISVPKHVVGQAALLHMADHWLRQDQGPPDARTARG